MNIPMLDLVSQYKSLKTEIDAAIISVLENGAYIMGPEVKQFEQNIASFLNVKHAIGVASGSDALILSLDALGIKPGDMVIVPTFTFFATAGSVSRLGAIPVFVDIDPNTYNINLEHTEQILRKKSGIKAIIPVHLFGLPCDMQRIMDIAETFGIKVIEDACQAINADIYLGATYQKAGTIGDIGCFSFFPSKNLGGYGDGGLVTTNDDALAEKMRILRTHGSRPKYYHQRIGYNSRLDSIQAAILNVKLNYLQQWTEKRKKVAQMYSELIVSSGLQDWIKIPFYSEAHVFHQYVIEIEKRDELASYLNSLGISSSVYYPLPLHLQECFCSLGYKPGDMPVSERVCKQVLALPIDPELTKHQIEYIVEAIKNFTITVAKGATL